jgi:hypothetical protein
MDPPGPQGLSQQSSSEFFLSNYRLGKTLGIGSFGKASSVAASGLVNFWL